MFVAWTWYFDSIFLSIRAFSWQYSECEHLPSVYFTDQICFNPLISCITFLYPLKMSEKCRFSDVFRGYKNVTLDINELKGCIFKCVCRINLIFWQDLPVSNSIRAFSWHVECEHLTNVYFTDQIFFIRLYLWVCLSHGLDILTGSSC